MVNCAYGYQKETEEEADQEEGCAKEEVSEEETGKEEGAFQESDDPEGRKQAGDRPEKSENAQEQEEEPGKSERSYPVAFAGQRPGASSGGQSGDLQGLSRIESADSESVNELIEEGNAFEADVVQGVTDAGNADEGEVHTHEVPEDDVPGEYLDKD